ncbi:MAG TPA: hypothetical protein VGP45_08280 [Marinobacter sp.]|jgi:hypothetical protein|nr:hypothetical protein [Marinobacter sp.]
MVERTPRTLETREATKRKAVWKRQSVIPAPEPRDGITFRWVRTSSLGNVDNMNVSRRFREGYTPVKAEDFPELKVLSDVGSRFKGNIEVGGLILCSIPTEQVEARIEGQAAEAQAQMDAVDNNYMRESDPRMPVLRPERSTRQTSFGK